MSKKLLIATCIVSAIAAGAAQATTITSVQFARQADRICARDYKAQAALGDPLVNADKVSRTDLPRAAAYLDKIVAITTSEVRSLAAQRRTERGMPKRHAFLATLRKVLADERAASAAAHQRNLAGFRTAYDRFILHGYPTGPDYRTLIHALKAAAKIFPFKVCGKGSAIYP